MTDRPLPPVDADPAQDLQRRAWLRRSGGLLVMTGLVGLAGCGGLFAKKPPPAPPAPPPMPPPPPPPKPGTLSMRFTPAGDLNPDARRRPSPVVLRLYELKATAAFEAADFLSLFEKDQAVLGADLLGREEFVLQPGDVRNFTRPLGGETRFLGVMAAFRDLERARWRAWVPLLPNQDNRVTVSLEGITVRATVAVP